MNTTQEDTELANYILSILKTQPPIVMSWGINPGTIKTIKDGLEFHVQGFKHQGIVRITLNHGTDTFEIHLIPDNEQPSETITDIYLDNLVTVIDRRVEMTDDYEERIRKEYGI